MADQGDKQKCKQQKSNKKRVVTRSCSRNILIPEAYSSDSDSPNNCPSSEKVKSNSNLAVHSNFFLSESNSSPTPDNLKRKHPETSDKTLQSKKSKEKDTRLKSKSSKGKSKMSSGSSTSLNDSLDNSASNEASDSNVADKPADISSVLASSFETINDGDADVNVLATDVNLIHFSDSSYLMDDKDGQDKSVNTSCSSSSSPTFSLARSESDASAEFPFSGTADESTEFRELLRKELINVRETFQLKSKRYASVIQHRKRLNPEKKSDAGSNENLERGIVRTCNLDTAADYSVPSGSRPYVIDEYRPDVEGVDPDLRLSSNSSQGTFDLPNDSNDSAAVQFLKLSSSALSKRSRHHASIAKNSDASSKASSHANSEEFISGSLAAALDAADAASFSATSDNSGTASGSSSESSSKDSELGRLQALLEARGIPLHVFGALGHRMQHLIHRSMGGNSSNSRVTQLLQGLQATGDESRQLQAVVEMCQLLVMGNEDTLIGFPVKQVVPVLINLLSMEHNFEMMNNACRALTYLMEALPRSSSVVVDAVPVFLNKIQVIQCMDVAEQSLTALEMLSKWHNKAILHAKGVTICLTYLDFFSINSQRAAFSIIANCFQNILPNEFSLVQESLPILSNWLSRQDEKSIESICLAFSRLVDCFQYDIKHLKEIASQSLLSNILELLLITPSNLSSQTFSTIMRMLALLCASSPELAILLLNLNIAETLCFLLIGNSDNYDIKLTPRSHQELLEISFLICELTPPLPTDGIFSIDSIVMKHKNRKKDLVVWKWRDDSGAWQSYSVSDSKLIETAYQSGVDSFRHTEETVTGESVTSLLDLNSLQQMSGDSSTKRPLKRCLSFFFEVQKSENEKSENKTDHFQDNSVMVNNCMKALFPVLYEIFCSSAGPSIRYNCLRAMLRMIHFAPASVLQLVLKSQLLSRNIAAMLASTDLKIIISALQMAQILLQKLPEVFGVHFIREGVMHEIRTLAKIDISSRLSELPSESPLFATNALRTASSSLMSSSKSFQLITSMPSFSQDSLPSSSTAKCSRKESPSESSSLVAKIGDLSKKHHGKGKESSSKKESNSAQNTASCSFACDKYEKINSWIREISKGFEDFFGVEEFEVSHPAVNVLNQLSSAVSLLEKSYGLDSALEPISQICSIMTEQDISSFELMHSGFINHLSTFLTIPPNSPLSDFEALGVRLRTFLNVFIGTPMLEVPFDQSVINASPLNCLVDKLNDCISHVEQFPVRVHDISSRSFSRRGSNALRFFNSHHLKCMFQRHPECSNLRQWKGGPVLIDPLASVHNIEQYLIAQGYGALKNNEEEEDDDDEEDEDDSDQSDNSDENMIDIAAALRMNPSLENQKLQFLISSNVLPSNMTIYQAVRQYAASEGQSSDNHDAESDDASGLSTVWTKTHIIFYRPLPPDAPEPDIVNSEVVITRSKTEKRKRQVSERSSQVKGSKKDEVKLEKSKTDSLWYEGKVPEVNPLLCFASSQQEFKSSSLEDPSLNVIYLLRIIHVLNSQWGLLYQLNSWEPPVSQLSFVNQKLTLKANRQLQDLISVMTSNVPVWVSHIAQEFPFLFPFQTRYLIFYVTSFDKDRALQRVIDVMPEVKNNDKIVPKFDKRKRTISRDGILKQAESILLEIANSRAVLEIQYKNEVGTGLGPTLEFYALISRELQRADLGMWRGEKTNAHNGKGVQITYVYSPVGLFPMPVPRSIKQSSLTRVCNKFKLLGNFLAKSVMDSRLLDIPLSLPFYRWMLNQDYNFTLSDLKHIDESLAYTVFKLEQMLAAKHKLEDDLSRDAPALKRALESLTLDGCPLDDLGLDFSVPGFPHVEMRKGGKDLTVTIHNLEEYLKLLKHWIMKEGVARQMKAFRDGFETVFPIKHLQIFYPHELELLFCGSEHAKWDVKNLMDCCRSDHGYSHESRAIRFLFDILCSYNQQQQRQFLQFITGSPRLPVGGLKSLSPPLTIVKKTSDDSTDSNSYLPSVMTCVNYLKLPDYSTIEIMREKLDMAVQEGQQSFHLS